MVLALIFIKFKHIVENGFIIHFGSMGIRVWIGPSVFLYIRQLNGMVFWIRPQKPRLSAYSKAIRAQRECLNLTDSKVLVLTDFVT